jgi:hypothetical protein
MGTFILFLKTTWYIWAGIIALSILKIFMPRIKGFFGEKSVAFHLSMLDSTKYKLINNIMLETGKKTTQIDHVVVSDYGVFVIETKNYKGWIIGNEYDNYWTQVIFKRKEKLYNPVRQNYGHIQSLKEILNEYKDINYISIVAFTTKVDLKVKAESDVVYTVNLLKTIKKYDIPTISDYVKEQIYARLISLNIDNKENRKAHVAAIHENISSRNINIDKNICPKCGGKLVSRRGKYGTFTGCSNYPKCKFTIKQ